jgi:hypothetical protein
MADMEGSMSFQESESGNQEQQRQAWRNITPSFCEFLYPFAPLWLYTDQDGTKGEYERLGIYLSLQSSWQRNAQQYRFGLEVAACYGQVNKAGSLVQYLTSAKKDGRTAP